MRLKLAAPLTLTLLTLAGVGTAQARRPVRLLPREAGVAIVQQAQDSLQVEVAWTAPQQGGGSVTGYTVIATGAGWIRQGSTPATQIADSLWLPRDTVDVVSDVCVNALAGAVEGPPACTSYTIPKKLILGPPGIPVVTPIGNLSGSVVRPPAGASVITVQAADVANPWIGWGGTAWMAHEPWSADYATWATWGPLARALLVNVLGLTDIRINLAAGVESDADHYLTAWNTGGPESIWNQQAWAAKDTDTFYWSSIDKVVDLIVNPLRGLITARGETPYILLASHGGTNWGNPAFYDSTIERQKMADRIVQAYIHLWTTYGWIPDAVSPVNEPDAMSEWTTAEYADLIYKIGTSLDANKTTFGQGGGWTASIIMPDVAYQGPNFATWFDATWNYLPGSGYPNRVWMTAAGFHVYDATRPNWTFTALNNRLSANNLPAYMAEYTGLTASLAHRVLKDAPETIMLHRFALKDWFEITGGGTGVELSAAAKLFRNYSYYVRPGAQRKAVAHSSEATTAGYDGIPWVKPNGRITVIVRTPSAAGDFWIDGLPAGTYGVNYGLGVDTDQTSNSNTTTISAWNQNLADVVLTAGSALKVSTTGVGVYTVYQK